MTDKMRCLPHCDHHKPKESAMNTLLKPLAIAALLIAAPTAALAQAPQPYQNRGNFRLTDAGRFHGYVSWPVYCGIAKCGDNWIAKVPVRANGAQAAPGPRARR